ncbi:MAG: hypothetical protein ABJC09_13700 [Terriglobia bacterium]
MRAAPCWLSMLVAAGALAAKPPAEEHGKAVFERVCSNCHPSSVVRTVGNSKQGWKDLVNEMLLRGGSATPDERSQIVDYLARKYPRRPGIKPKR